jgi:FkbM family methyltransferase
MNIGASEGDFRSSVERYCGLKRAMLIEPQPKRVEELKCKFRAPRFSVHCAAAAAENGSATMEVLNWDYSTSLLPIRRNMPDAYGSLDIDVREVIPVRTLTLGELCRDLPEGAIH